MTADVHPFVTLPADVLVATHLAAAVVGGLAVYLAVVHWGDRVTAHLPAQELPVMPNRKLRRGTWLGIVLLIASGMVVSIGVAASLQQRNSDRADQNRAAELKSYSQCISQWGADLVATINARNAERTRYDAANQARADAFAGVVRVIIGLRVDPPRATDRDLTRVLAEAEQADDRVRRAAAALSDAQAGNTYESPTLACGRTP